MAFLTGLAARAAHEAVLPIAVDGSLELAGQRHPSHGAEAYLREVAVDGHAYAFVAITVLGLAFRSPCLVEEAEMVRCRCAHKVDEDLHSGFHTCIRCLALVDVALALKETAHFIW